MIRHPNQKNIKVVVFENNAEQKFIEMSILFDFITENPTHYLNSSFDRENSNWTEFIDLIDKNKKVKPRVKKSICDPTWFE